MWTKKCEIKGGWGEFDFKESVEVWIKRPNLSNKIVSCSSISDPPKDLNLNSFNQFLEGRPISQWNVRLRKLVPKRSIHEEANELVIHNGDCTYVFVPLLPTGLRDERKVMYSLTHSRCGEEKDSIVSMATWNLSGPATTIKDVEAQDCHPTMKWLSTVLLPNLAKYMNNNSTSEFPVSHSLINSEQYARTYEKLKNKYSKKISQEWPEVTDPQKYVTEDVAIASYLLVLWKAEREAKKTDKLQTFLDIGCGNGLLTHILNCEGHKGKGVDLRKRKVWSMYGAETKLEEHCVTPEDAGTMQTVEGYDWLLGNHCDELTPWMAVMASRCRHPTNVWLLPCCFFDLFGKYERRKSSVGQYRDYIDYIASLFDACALPNSIDVMRIPSTKRVCIVGRRERKAEEGELERIDSLIEDKRRRLAHKRKQRRENNNDDATEFVPRAKTEPVQNCTRLAADVTRHVIETVTGRLLATADHVTVPRGGGGREWNRGGELSLGELARLFDDATRRELKNECGGLQTLLRNHHQVFLVQGGSVRLRDWSDLGCVFGKRRKRKRNDEHAQHQHKLKATHHKSKPCWFDTSHPDGCPRSPQDCPFLHSTES